MGFTLRRAAAFLPSLVLAGLLTGCGGMSASAPAFTPASSTANAPQTATAMSTAADASFVTWLETARGEALKRGIGSATVSGALGAIAPIPRVIELDRRQPEFSNTFTRYLGNAVTESRVNEGRAMLQKHASLLADLERKYGVQGRFLVAFWGLETNYGRVKGDYPVVTALATLAYDGRRGAFFREEMFNALTILDRGHIELPKMKGSWAGAMGHTQFMPSTFLRYAVDEDRDGHIDVWGSVPDALGSGANYLKALNWDGTRTWGREVQLPAAFDVALASMDTDAKENMRPLSFWSESGVRQADGSALPVQDLQASLVLPAGSNGPAFLVYDNFRAILKWNRSAFYAIAVGHLADRLIGGGGLQKVTREGDPLRREEVLALQESLVALGFLKYADGIMGSGTRQAVRAFQKANGLPQDGYPDRALIAAARAKAP
jgi:membrane-bound lytic murein transglycosylase B